MTYLAEDLQGETHVLEKRVPVASSQACWGLEVPLILVKVGVGAVL